MARPKLSKEEREKQEANHTTVSIRLKNDVVEALDADGKGQRPARVDQACRSFYKIKKAKP